MIEYLERLGCDGDTEDWVVRHDGALANAHIYTDVDQDPAWHEKVAARSRPWVGLRHPSLIPLHAIEVSDRLVTVTGDERGPTLVQAAEKLVDIEERERWATAEIAGIAEAVTAMAARQPGFVHMRLDHGNMLVGQDGHARLRAPVAFVALGPRRGYVGQGRVVHGTALQWLAPEQVMGSTTTPATDVFQLANTLYTGLSLQRAFKRGDSNMEMLVTLRDVPRPPAPPTTIPGLADLVLANLAKEPAHRDPDPATFAAKLRALVPEAPASTYAKVAALRGNHHVPANRSVGITGYRCPKQWDELSATAAPGIRHCATCDNNVVQVRSIDALVPLLGKSCIAYTPDD